MAKFMNVVRSKVKEGMKGTDGLISMKQIQTGPNNMCIVGE